MSIDLTDYPLLLSYCSKISISENPRLKSEDSSSILGAILMIPFQNGLNTNSVSK
jgi:hypothetical protein